jgi:hypothetical protein
MSHLDLRGRLKIRPGQLEGFKALGGRDHAGHSGSSSTTRTSWWRGRVLFRDYAFDHHMTVSGDVSQQLRDLTTERAGGINGLDHEPDSSAA